MKPCKQLLVRKLRGALRLRLGWMRDLQTPLWGMADEIMKFYAPDAKFEKKLGSWSWCEGSEGDYTIRWRTGHGLHTLLHELGHRHYQHPDCRMAKSELDRWEEFLTEVEAWLWAEEECHKLGLPFDYADAEKALRPERKRYNVAPLVKPNWKYKTI